RVDAASRNECHAFFERSHAVRWYSSLTIFLIPNFQSAHPVNQVSILFWRFRSSYLVPHDVIFGLRAKGSAIPLAQMVEGDSVAGWVQRGGGNIKELEVSVIAHLLIV
ncbi:unnamed protein product, partial [Mycena citricolor]